MEKYLAVNRISISLFSKEAQNSSFLFTKERSGATLDISCLLSVLFCIFFSYKFSKIIIISSVVLLEGDKKMSEPGF